MATLRDEGISIESWFLLSREDGDYLLSYMRSEELDKASAAVKDSLHEIDAYHQRFMQDACEQGGRETLELLVDLTAENDLFDQRIVYFGLTADFPEGCGKAGHSGK